ncbi:MAG: enoyl-CoA hydratase [Gammaproteobacteria bacterium]|nr:enoyl-CoA hydratase [Gammaproteobacteria bacterium]
MSATECVEFTDYGEHALLELRNESKNNAMSMAMWRELDAILDELLVNERVRVLVVRGHGQQAFCAGADISEFDARRSDAAQTKAYDALVERTCQRLESVPVPTVAMIHGFCIGGGLSLAAACDLRVCDHKATFSLPAARLGLGYDVCGVERLVKVLGAPFAKEILYTARPIDAERARAMGLVHQVSATEELADYVDELAGRIRHNAPLSIRAMKCSVQELTKTEAERDLAQCQALVDRCNRSEDYREGRAAFAEKREPVFRGR